MTRDGYAIAITVAHLLITVSYAPWTAAIIGGLPANGRARLCHVAVLIVFAVTHGLVGLWVWRWVRQ